jgi:hypothetical protein
LTIAPAALVRIISRIGLVLDADHCNVCDFRPVRAARAPPHA